MCSSTDHVPSINSVSNVPFFAKSASSGVRQSPVAHCCEGLWVMRFHPHQGVVPRLQALREIADLFYSLVDGTLLQLLVKTPTHFMCVL